MATYQDEMKLVMKVQGQEEIRALEEAVKGFEANIRDLSAELAAGTISQQQFEAAARANAASILQMQGRIRELQGATRNLGMAALEGSRALEDLQYGVAGVVNNIPGLVMSLGGGAGLTAAISLAAVGVNQLVKHWHEFKEALGLAGTETEAERMERLEHATKRTAEETRQLNEYKKEQAEIQRLLDSMTPEAEAQKSGVTKALAGHAGEVADALVNQQKIEKGEASLITDPALRAAYLENRQRAARLRATGDRIDLAAAEGHERDAAQILAPFIETARHEAAGFLTAAEKDPAKLRELIGDLDRMGGGGPVAGLMGDLENALPENVRRQRELELAGAARGRQLREEAAARKKVQQEAERHAEQKAEEDARRGRQRANQDADELNRRQKARDEAAREAERARKEAARKAQHAADKAAREHEQHVNQQAALYGHQFGEMPEQALFGGMSPDAVTGQLTGLTGDREVAAKITADAVEKLRARFAAEMAKVGNEQAAAFNIAMQFADAMQRMNERQMRMWQALAGAVNRGERRWEGMQVFEPSQLFMIAFGN